MSTVSDVLNESAALLNREGWCQRALHSPTGEHCMVGAISAVLSFRIIAGRPIPASSASRLAYRAIVLVRPRDLPAISRCVEKQSTFDYAAAWNDAKGRTCQEVVHVLCEAAKRLA